MKRMLFVAAVLLFGTVGCVTPSYKSMNIQRSGIRCTGDTATTIALDSLSSAAEADSVRMKVKEVALVVQSLLKDGKVSALTVPEVTQALEKLVPENYRFLLDIALSQIEGITLPTQKVGTDNVERINSVCVGVIQGCDLYDVKYRPVPATTAKALAPVVIKGTAESRFGACLKKEMGVK